MARNFNKATKAEDDYAFEEADDFRTWFGDGRDVAMECDEARHKADIAPGKKEDVSKKENKLTSPNLNWWEKGQYA